MARLGWVGARFAAPGRLLTTSAIVVACLGVAAPADAAVCQSSTGPSGAYSVTICLQGPAPNATLIGPSSVAATVSTTGTAPAVKKVVFSLGSAYVLSDFQAPYSFTLPTTKWADGLYALKATATMTDGFASGATSESVTLANGITRPALGTGTFTPSRGTTPPAGQPFVLAAAGDGAAGDAVSGTVANLISSWSPNLFLYLGDVYERGSPAEFSNWYGSGSQLFGQLKSVTNPTIGNHEYFDGEPVGYLDYWNNAPHYYSVNAGGWHLVSLDSTTDFNQVTPGSAQYEWLKQDLAANQTSCTLVYFHHPYMDVTNPADDVRLSSLWSLMAQSGVDAVLNGHAHNYQRWQPVGANGALDASGPTQLVVGTAGHGIERFTRTDTRLAKGIDAAGSYGALRMNLSPSGATYSFVTTAGATLDSGSFACGAAPAPGPKPFFTDGFESGSMSSWTSSTGIAVQNQEKYAGLYGARATTTGAAAFARKQLSAAYSNLYARMRFKVVNKPAANVYLAKLRDTADASVLGVSVNETGNLALTNYFTGAKYTGPAVAAGWHEVQVHALVKGAASQTETWLDGVRLSALSPFDTLGNTPVDKLQLGDQSTGRAYDIAFDDVAASTGFIFAGAPAPSPSPAPSSSSSPSPAPPLFADGFESGTLGAWPSPAGLTVQTLEKYAGAYGVRATSTGGPTFAKHQLPSPFGSLYARVRFKVIGKSNYVYLLKLRDVLDNSVLGLYVADGGQLAYTNYVTGSKWTSSTAVPAGWHTVEIHAVVGGTGQTETWLDGVMVAELSRAESLGAVLLDKLQLGDNSTGKIYDVAFDDVAANTSFIP